ncbi:MAG TPA: membrane dipeptidase [Parachlamydiaceae bacterium]|nr:membrane dipeptidase [Parachlamydiaceae bacterium]
MNSKIALADLHCDLLWYLSLNPKRTANDPDARCAIPQLREGGVKVQTMAIFVETNAESVASGQEQADIFRKLPALYPDDFTFFRQEFEAEHILQKDQIGIVPAIENASAICTEEEDLSAAMARLTTLQKKIGKLLYVSLTWNSENRFGGGALTKVGLKEDGKLLVDYLCEKGIPLDFSHTSDYLAYDLLNYMDKKGHQLPILASHSNMRSVTNVPRNLPDDVAKEIIKKKGVIGINFVRSFVGNDSPLYFARHLEHLLKLGAEKNICFGADFFCVDDLPLDIRKPLDATFFPFYNHAGAYGNVLELWRNELTLSEGNLEAICSGNFLRFFKEVIFPQGS